MESLTLITGGSQSEVGLMDRKAVDVELAAFRKPSQIITNERCYNREVMRVGGLASHERHKLKKHTSIV
jgi:hypothetical protein